MAPNGGSDVGMAGGSSQIDRGTVARRRNPRLPFVKWMAAWTIVAAILGGIFGVTRLLGAIAGEPSVAGIAPFIVTGIWAGVIAVPYLAVLWALCGAALALALYLIYLAIGWLVGLLHGPAAAADESSVDGPRRVGE